jgi:hypothetical protein
MEESEKGIQKIKEILEKQHSREFTWEEATKAYRDMETFARIALAFAEKELKMQELLKQSPKGFYYQKEHGKCALCGDAAFGENSWYDKYGLKCTICQNAIDQKVIPGNLAKNRESWYTQYDLQSFFNISKKELIKYIKSGFLNDRVIHTASNKVHLQLFLLQDNKSTLPPKKLLKGKIITVERNGEQFFTDARWYEFVEVKNFERLKKYRIIECFSETFAKPIIETGRFYWKSHNPIFTHD